MDFFPAGRVPLLVCVAAVLSGAVVTARWVRQEQGQFTLWTFTYLSADGFSRQLDEHGLADQVRLQNLGRAMTERLALAVMTGKDLPDLVEVEQSEFGQYLRGPIEQIPFVDLTDRLRGEGWHDRLIASRLARYSHAGRVYGIPRDVHPAVLVYRPDVLADLGYRPDDLATWDDWFAAARDFYRPGAAGSSTWRYGLALSDVEAYDFLMLLWQRGGDVFDAAGEVIIDNELAVDTLEFYIGLFRGDPPACGPKLSGWNEDFAALARGQIVALPAVDWMLATMRMEADAALAGKVRCMPLPAWEAGGRRTSTSGGTMMGIPRDCRDVDQSWEIAKQLYFDKDALIATFRRQSVVPALRSVYDDPAFDEPVAFFQGQPVGRLLTQLAEEVPTVQGSPYAPTAYALLNALFAEVMKQRVSPRDALTNVARELRDTMARDRKAIEAAKR